MYPVAQVQEPYSVVGYLAARVPLVDLLRLEHPNPDLLSDAKRQPEKLEPTGSSTAEEENSSARANSIREGEDTERDSSKSYATDGQLWTPWDVCDGEHNFASLCNRRLMMAINSLARFLPSY